MDLWEMTPERRKELADFALQMRTDCIRMTNHGQSGHIGSMLSMTELVAFLYNGVLNVSPDDPRSDARDRFLLSKGHAGAAVYAALCRKGFFPEDWLMTYYRDNGKLMGHISHHVPGVEFSTGSLGHGLPVAAGMALAAKKNAKPHRVFCLMSDGDMNEGSTWEAIVFAAQQKLDRLVGIIDYNDPGARLLEGHRRSRAAFGKARGVRLGERDDRRTQLRGDRGGVRKTPPRAGKTLDDHRQNRQGAGRAVA